MSDADEIKAGCCVCCLCGWAKLTAFATCIPMLIFAFRWKSDVLSQLGQTDPCDVLTTVDVDNFKLTVASEVLVPLIVVGFLVLLTFFIAGNHGCNRIEIDSCKWCSLISLALLLTVLVTEGILFGIIAAGISTGADYYKSAIRDTPNPMKLYNWYNGSDNCSAAMDKFQSEALCCGYHNLTEWDITRPSNWNKDIFPPSCCTDFALRSGSPDDRKWCTKKMISFFDVSCVSQLKSWIFRQWVATVAWIALGVGLFQIFCVVLWKINCYCEPALEGTRIIDREDHVPVPVPVVRPPRIVRRMQYEEIQE